MMIHIAFPPSTNYWYELDINLYSWIGSTFRLTSAAHASMAVHKSPNSDHLAKTNPYQELSTVNHSNVVYFEIWNALPSLWPVSYDFRSEAPLKNHFSASNFLQDFCCYIFRFWATDCDKFIKNNLRKRLLLHGREERFSGFYLSCQKLLSWVVKKSNFIFKTSHNFHRDSNKSLKIGFLSSISGSNLKNNDLDPAQKLSLFLWSIVNWGPWWLLYLQLLRS